MGKKKLTSNQATPAKKEPATAAKTKLQFVQKSPNHLGSLKFGEVKTHTIEFTNVGKNEYKVDFISGSCSCTEIVDYSRKVAPGQKGYVKIKFDSKKANVQKAYPSGIEMLGNTEDPLTLYSISVDVTN